VRPAGLERHRVGLTARVHHRLRELVAARIDAAKDLEGDARTRVRPRVAPGRHRPLRRLEQHVGVDVGVGDAEVDAVRRPLARHLAVGAGRLDRERLAEVGVESGLALRR
jgi:hypothetical protein